MFVFCIIRGCDRLSIGFFKRFFLVFEVMGMFFEGYYYDFLNVYFVFVVKCLCVIMFLICIRCRVRVRKFGFRG